MDGGAEKDFAMEKWTEMYYIFPILPLAQCE